MGIRKELAAIATAMIVSESVNAASLSKCTTGEDASVEDISSVNWPSSWRFTLDPGDACYHTTFMTSYAWWPDDQEILTKTQNYVIPATSSEECMPDESNLDYSKGDKLYTVQSAWPHT